MPNAPHPKLTSIAPVFPVTDIQHAKDYYSGKLLFEIAFEWMDQESDTVNYVILRKNNCDLHLSKSETDHRANAYVFVDGID